MEKPQWTLCSLSAHHVGDSAIIWLIWLIQVNRVRKKKSLWSLQSNDIEFSATAGKGNWEDFVFCPIQNTHQNKNPRKTKLYIKINTLMGTLGKDVRKQLERWVLGSGKTPRGTLCNCTAALRGPAQGREHRGRKTRFMKDTPDVLGEVSSVDENQEGREE